MSMCGRGSVSTYFATKPARGVCIQSVLRPRLNASKWVGTLVAALP